MPSLKNWIRWRWWELRTGSGNYLSQAVTFINLVLLVSLRFSLTGTAFYGLVVFVFVGLSSVSILLGNMHRRWQQDTDARLTNKILIEDISDAVIRKMREQP